MSFDKFLFLTTAALYFYASYRQWQSKKAFDKTVKELSDIMGRWVEQEKRNRGPLQ